MEPRSVVTLTIFHFPPGRRLWPFVAMAPAGGRLAGVARLRFRKMMGAGAGLGFSARPDFGRYGLLGVWQSREDAERFLHDSRFMQLYRRRAARITTWYLEPDRVHGEWDGSSPFAGGTGTPPTGLPRSIAVLTRATIRLRHLPRFWRMVRPVSDELARADGLRYSIGLGEVPWIRQATFSVWESAEAMKAFAYGAPIHREVVRRTREEGWYAEDLFARFTILDREEWSDREDRPDHPSD